MANENAQPTNHTRPASPSALDDQAGPAPQQLVDELTEPGLHTESGPLAEIRRAGAAERERIGQ